MGGMGGMGPPMMGGMGGFGLFPNQPANFRPGDWMCNCGNHNYASRAACVKCGTQKAVVLGGMGGFGMGIGGRNLNLPPNFRPGDWICKCGNHNYHSRTSCGRCRETKDSADRTGLPGVLPPNFQIGDWMCTCGAHNYQSKTACYKCQLSKESAQADPSNVAAKALPSFRAGDWICKSCNNHNYASRVACGRCKLPKPAETRERSRSPTGHVATSPR